MSEDGYLLGYLWIKALWRILVQRCGKLSDTDLFLSFLISYFFEDLQLANLLFKWTDAMKSSSSIEEYADIIECYLFGIRLDGLLQNVKTYVEQYESYATQFLPGSLKSSGEIANRPAYHNYSPELESGIEMSLAYGSIRSMHVMWPKFFGARHILRIFTTAAEVKIDERGYFVAACNDGTKIEGASLEIARPISKVSVAGNGSVEAIFLTNKMQVVICVFLGRELIATIDAVSEKFNDDETAEICDKLSSFLALEAASVGISGEVYFREGSKAHGLAVRMRQRAKSKRDEFYSNLGLGTDTGLRPSAEILGAASSKGIAQVLKDYPQCTEWLVRLSLSCSGKVATCGEAAGQWNVPTQAILHWLEKVNASVSDRCHKQAFVTDGDNFGFCQF